MEDFEIEITKETLSFIKLNINKLKEEERAHYEYIHDYFMEHNLYPKEDIYQAYIEEIKTYETYPEGSYLEGCFIEEGSFDYKVRNSKIYAKNLDQKAEHQFKEALSLECNIRGALMADAHGGYTLPVGAVIESKGAIFPSYVGYDIGCGVSAVKLDITKENINLKDLKEHILKKVPVGDERHKSKQKYESKYQLSKKGQELVDKVGPYNLGVLGDGNHFINISEGYDGKLWIVVHCGSIDVGEDIASYYMEAAIKNTIKNPSTEFIKKNKEGHFYFKTDSQLGKDYFSDMNYALQYAKDNRRRIIDNILTFLNYEKEEVYINKNHNHAVLTDNSTIIHRKGATPAEKGEPGIIAGNMIDGCFIVEGLGNPDSLMSSSHGAGRKLTRTEAAKVLNHEECLSEFGNLEHNFTEKNVVEAKEAYKDIFEVMELQKDLVKIVDKATPILNING